VNAAPPAVATGMSLSNVHLSFAGVVALGGVSFDVPNGSITALIGPNGAGKSTVLNVMSGIYTPDEGDAVYDGNRLTQMRPHQVARLGVARTFQNLAVSPRATVHEVLRQGCHTRARAGVVANALRTPRARRASSEIHEVTTKVAEEVGLAPLLSTAVGDLSYGQRKFLEFGRALCMRPSLLLLDEPAAGLTHSESRRLAELIRSVAAELGATVVLVEHDVPLVLDLCDHVIVMDFGRILSQGSAQHVRDNPDVLAAYLGHSNGADHE
jgi:ABC-type branched-subunit amino acid transport system ATPase component